MLMVCSMLQRLNTANDEIVEVLLSKQQLLPALRSVWDQQQQRNFEE